MEVYPDKQATEELYAKIAEAMSKEVRDGIHVSDLLQPRKAYWQRVQPLPPTIDEIGFWLVGKGHHYFLVHALTGVEDSQEESLVDQEAGIKFSPDLLTLHGEFKTSRWFQVPTDRESVLRAIGSYIPQCRMYAALLRVNEWRLYVAYIAPTDPKTKRKNPRLKVYKLVFTDEELEQTRADIAARKIALEEALAKKDHTQLPLCPEYFCYRMEGQGRGRPRKMVPVCKWFESYCKPEGRYASKN